ncbi:MBL fold metallo-hydrolase [Halobacteriales archaeon Cl-PHB]
MKLTFLGTGSAMPDGERVQTGLLLETGDDALLVDCGSGAIHSLARTDVGYEGVDAVLLTHHHLDHIADLLPLAKARWLAGAETLPIVGPPGTEDLVADLLDVHDYLAENVDLEVSDVEPADMPIDLAGFDVTAMETRHSMPCHAYRFDPGAEEGPEVVFSGDSEPFPELVAFADGAAVLAHDCSFPDEIDVSNHPTPASLGAALAEADADVGRVYLTHLYPHTNGKHEAMLESVGTHYDGDVRLARDGLSIEVS